MRPGAMKSPELPWQRMPVRGDRQRRAPQPALALAMAARACNGTRETRQKKTIKKI
jgi:hypothetical protein